MVGTNRTKASSSGLGKALINRKHKEAIATPESQLYTLDDSNPLASVTHERDLDEFLSSAALANTDFTTERSKMRIISAPSNSVVQGNPYLLTREEEREVAKRQVERQGGLRVPRRPAWSLKTTRLELEKQERESFLDWRRGLAELAEETNLLLTPFERNIQLWRQLWRVLERSQLIVQIVDARNPLGFRCLDLESYVKEVGSGPDEDEITVPGKGKRRSLLLVNKADLLTFEQRSAWADYFESEKITYAFFSAADAAAAIEQAEKQRKREAGEDEYAVVNDDQEDDDSEDDDAAYASGEDVAQEDKVGGLAEQVEDATLDEEEEGWSTEGEQDDKAASAENGVDKKLANGEKVPLKDVVREVVASSGQEQVEHIRTRVLSVTELEDLFESAAPDLKDFTTARHPNPPKLMVGLVGYPNVGKSSTINALIGSKKVSVSATPGKTKHFQTLVLSDRITLCDCPGLVFPQFANTQADMVVDGVLPIDQMREYSAPVDLVCRRVPREILEGVYGIRIDVKEEEEGGTGKVGWEDLLSTYAIARGLTRASFGMPDTSRAARYILKDYVNAKLLYAHPPPGMDSDDFMSTSRERTLRLLEQSYQNGRKRAPVTHVGKIADTYVRPAGGVFDVSLSTTTTNGTEIPPQSKEKQRQLTTQSVRASAASAPMRSGRAKADALDGVFFNEAGPAPRPVVKGRQNVVDEQEGGLGFSRPTQYPHQRMLGPDGMPLLDQGKEARAKNGLGSKKHFKVKEGKKRSGRGYD